MVSTHLLLVEDEHNFGAVLKDYLGMQGFKVTWCKDGEEGARVFHTGQFDLCILDIMMPLKDGFTLAQEIRKARPQQPIIFLTARAMREDVIQGFKLGADDYITKPFDSEELLYRIRAIIKRSQGETATGNQPQQFTLYDYVFDHELRTLSFEGKNIRLSPKESDLLHLLCLQKNELLSRENALRMLWGDDNYFNGRSMDVFVSKLRKHFKNDPRIRIENIHGKGFRLVIEGG